MDSDAITAHVMAGGDNGVEGWGINGIIDCTCQSIIHHKIVIYDISRHSPMFTYLTINRDSTMGIDIDDTRTISTTIFTTITAAPTVTPSSSAYTNLEGKTKGVINVT